VADSPGCYATDASCRHVVNPADTRRARRRSARLGIRPFVQRGPNQARGFSIGAWPVHLRAKITVHSMARPGESVLFLDVQIQRVAGRFMLVAIDRWRRPNR